MPCAKGPRHTDIRTENSSINMFIGDCLATPLSDSYKETGTLLTTWRYSNRIAVLYNAQLCKFRSKTHMFFIIEHLTRRYKLNYVHSFCEYIVYFVRYQSARGIKGVLDACTISSADKRSR